MQGARAADPSPGGYLVVYGVKTVTPTHITHLYSVDPSNGEKKMIFSDETSSVMVLNRDGGGETALHEVVALNPSQRKAIALASLRPNPGAKPSPAPSLYELSLDGSNAVRKIAVVEALIAFAVSRDGEQIAYFLRHPNRLVIRSTGSGIVTREIGLEGGEFADLPSLRWSPDGSAILIRRWSGPEYETEYDIAHLPEARIERTGIRGEIYSFLPKSGRLLGAHLIYDKSNTSPRRQFFSMALPGQDPVNLPLPLCREAWQAEVSPDEKLIAFPCKQGILISALAGGEEKRNGMEVPVGRAEVIGWIVK